MELKPNQVRLMMLQVADAIIAAEPMLSQADRDLGDGDHGTNMHRGFHTAQYVDFDRLAADLQEAFPDMGGLSARNQIGRAHV